MSCFFKLDLEFMPNKYLHLNEDYLKTYEQELLDFLEDKDYMRTLSFAKQMMMGQEIKSNHAIEGIMDDLSIIDEVIRAEQTPISGQMRKRIINLYHGYQYILNHKTIDKEHLKELYAILSNGILEPEDVIRMGKYYRTAPVYILNKGHIADDYFMGAKEDKVEYYMDQFFEYVNHEIHSNSEIDHFIKSQIMHFYFVYIHPYFDVNGRTSRTVSMWYLLNHQNYPYIIFNRAIAFAKKEYEANIIKGRSHGDITLFLKYMLVQVERELEKEHLIYSIKEKTNFSLTKEDCQMLEYFLSMKGNLTAKNLAIIYNQYNEPRKTNVVFDEKIAPLLEKGILVNLGYTKGYMKQGIHNFNIGINPSIVDVDPKKVKHLELRRFIL